MSTLTDLRTWTIANVAGWSSANTFITRQPDEPDVALTLYAYTGTPQYSLGRGEAYHQTRVQARVRSTTYADAYTRIMALRSAYNGSSVFERIMCLDTEPTELEPDAQDRVSLVLNFNIMKEPS